jgi:hypothetical protein
MYFDVDEALRKAREIYGELDVDGHYGEQVVIKQDENLFMYIEPWLSYREVWESSKRILDVKEDEKWMIKTKAKN